MNVTNAGKGALKVAFAAPSANGARITRYTAACKSSNGGKAGSKSAPAGPLKVGGLTAGATYHCTVKAANSRGTGPACRNRPRRKSLGARALSRQPAR